MERAYNIPLRKSFRNAPKYKRTNKAVAQVKNFLSQHMKSDDIKLGKELNDKLWEKGIQNPPHHVKVVVTKDDEGVVKAELEGVRAAIKKDAKPTKTADKKPVAHAKVSKTEIKDVPAVENPA